jgi:hypothetical protein
MRLPLTSELAHGLPFSLDGGPQKPLASAKTIVTCDQIQITTNVTNNCSFIVRNCQD